MKTQNSFSHLTLAERRIILAGITNGSTKTAIAQTIGKDKSTVGKEIKLHRTLTHKCKMPLECTHYKNVSMAASVHLTVRSTVLSAAPGATAPLVPATAVPTGHAAVLINTSTLRKRPIWITALL